MSKYSEHDLKKICDDMERRERRGCMLKVGFIVIVGLALFVMCVVLVKLFLVGRHS